MIDLGYCICFYDIQLKSALNVQGIDIYNHFISDINHMKIVVDAYRYEKTVAN